MKTENLIRALSAEAKPGPGHGAGLGAGVALALLAGLAGAVLLFAVLLAPRHGMPALLAEPRILLKFMVTLTLAAAALATALRLARPGAEPAPAAWSLIVPVVFFGAGAVAELAATPESNWLAGLVGHSARYCVSLIPLLSTPLLGALLLALRRGAPAHPALAGAVAGLVAGGLGAGLYALHCTDDSALFVLVWYSLGIAIVTLAGAALGRRVLAW